MDDQNNNPTRGQAGQGVSVGVGLQESRLNTDLIDFLRKYGPYALYVTLIIVGIYAATNWFQQREAQAMDNAFMALNRALETNSPDELLRVASEHAGRGSVAELANLRAALIIAEAARLGVTPETPMNLRANPPAENRLTDEQAAAQFARAEELYRAVLQRTRGSGDRYLVAQQARWNLATALAAQGKFEEAKQMITEYGETARRGRWEAHASVADQRLALLTEAASFGTLPRDAELPDANRGGATMPSPLPAQPGLGTGPTIRPQQGMPIPGANPVAPQPGMTSTPITDPAVLERLNAQLRQQQQQQGGMPIPQPTPQPAPDPAPAPEPEPAPDNNGQ
jgi:hypothetical protein